MPSITWLHLSDLHACHPRTGWDAELVLERLRGDLRRLRQRHGLAPELLFFTGDAAFGHLGSEPGKSIHDQFEEFGHFLDEIRKEIDPAFPWENVFLVPGNHDVDRTQVDAAHTDWQDNPRRRLEEVIELVQAGGAAWKYRLERLAAYREFLIRHGKLEHLLQDSSRLIYTAVRQLGGLRVGIAGFNTAWSCCREQEQGRLWMAGEWQLGTLRPRLADCDVTVALLHHPPDWMATAEKTSLSTALDNAFHFVLHGHEHSQWVRPLVDSSTTLAAGACYEGSAKENGYSVVRLDLDSGKGEVWLRRYEKAGGWVGREIPKKTDPRGVWTLRPKWLTKLRTARPTKSRRGQKPESWVDASAELTRYLWKLQETRGYLPIAGFETRVRIPLRLDEVFVPLRAGFGRSLAESAEKGSSALAEREADGVEDRDVPFAEALSLARQAGKPGVVILGEPGSGKTTLLKHFALEAIEISSRGQELGYSGVLIPVFITLRRLKSPAGGIQAALDEAVAEVLPSEEAARFSKALVDRDRLLVLLDGLDEVANPEEREAVSRWLEAALGQLPSSTFVVTSRYSGYRGDARLDGRFLELRVRDLVESEARAFVERWYGAVEAKAVPDRSLEVSRGVAQGASNALAERLFASEDPRVVNLRPLAANPLLLQILCLVHRDRATLPERRAELYAESLSVLLERWREAKGLPVEISARMALKLLQPLAWWLHCHELKEVSLSDVNPHLAAPLAELGVQGDAVEALLAVIRDQSGVLVSLGLGRYSFLHLSFQEYLAARHVQDRLLAEPALLTELASHFGEPWWREVILLAVGLDNPTLFAPLVAELLRQETLSKDSGLADDLLLDSLGKTPLPLLEALEAGIASRDERYAALRLLQGLARWREVATVSGASGQAIVARLAAAKAKSEMDKPTARLAAELVGLDIAEPPIRGRQRATPQPGEERVHPADGSVLVYVPGGVYTLGSEEISSDEKPVHRVRLNPFWVGKYPVTNEQYRRYLLANPEIEEPKFWTDKNFNQPRQPVVGVSWHEAKAYCLWAGLALPCEAQWEAAARGTDQRLYPWGNETPSPIHANFGGRGGKTTPVGAYPAGTGPFGTLDQAGNVWEWCADGWDAKAYQAREGALDPLSPPGSGDPGVALRGGSWNDPASFLAAAYRNRNGAWNRNLNFGFRCVLVGFSEPD